MESQRVGIRIERPAEAPWTVTERTALRRKMFQLFSITQMGINANRPEAEMTIPAEMSTRMNGMIIDEVGTIVIDNTVTWSKEWKHPSLKNDAPSA